MKRLLSVALLLFCASVAWGNPLSDEDLKLIHTATWAQLRGSSQIILQFYNGTTSLGSKSGGTLAIACDGTSTTCTYSGSKLTITAAGGGGGVTSVATTAPITGGTITTTGTIACATCTTNAAALTASQLVIGGGGQAAAALGALGTTTTVLHGNAAGAPSYGAVALATDVSGQLPITAVGSAGLSGTAPISISAAGAISLTNPLPIANGGTGNSTTVSAHNYFGNNTGSSAAPAFLRPVCADLSDSASGCSTAALGTPVTVANGGTGTGSTLTGVVRGGSPMTASELSGVVITSASNVTTPGKIDVTNANAFCQAAGASGTTYTCNLSPAITAYVTGTHYRFKADVANSGAATINFNAVGAISIKKAAGGITTALVANDLQAGQWVDLIYDGTNMQMQSTLGNAPGGGLSGLTSGTPQFASSTSAIAPWGRTIIVDGTTTTAIPATPAATTRYLITADVTQAAAITVSNANVTIECSPGTKITRSTATDLFDVTGNNFTLKGCLLDGNSLSTSGTGPLVTIGNSSTAANDAIIRDNVIQNAGTTNAQTGTILVQNGNRAFIYHNTWTGTVADRAIYVFPLSGKNCDNEVIDHNYINLFNPGTAAVAAIHATDSNTGGATVNWIQVTNNTVFGQGANANIIHVQGSNIGQSATTPRGGNVSFNNVFFTGQTNFGMKIYSFFNGRMVGNLIDDQNFTSANLINLGDTYNSTFAGNTLRAQAVQGPVWLSLDESGNSTVGNQIFGVPGAFAGFRWESTGGPLTSTSITSNNVQLTTALAGICYQVMGGISTFLVDSNVISGNNCTGTSTAGQEGLDLNVLTASGATTMTNTNILGNDFVNVPTGIKITGTAQTGAGPAVIRTVNIGNNSFETVTTGIQISPPNSSGGGAINVSGVAIDGNSFRSVTTMYSATPGTANSIAGTTIGNNFYDTVTTLTSDTGTATQFNHGLQVVALTSDFTSGSGTTNLQTITGLSFTLQSNLAQTVTFSCHLSYSQATNVSDAFGIQAATFSPTRIDARGYLGTSTTATTFGALANLATTTATAIVTATPTVTTTNGVELSGTIQNPSNASAQTVNIMVSQATAADVIVVKAGSSCEIKQ